MTRKISHSLINGRAGAGTAGQGLKVEWDSTNDGELHWMDVDESSLEYVAPYGGTSYGFSAGGAPTANADVVNRFSFTSDGNAGDWGDLAIGNNQGSGQSSATHGYNSGGWLASGGSTAGSNIIQKFSFSTTNTSSDVADLAHSVYVVCGGQSSSDNGYACGGRTSTEHDYIQKFNFATEANATDIGNLIGIAQKTAGHSSSTHGWVSGGVGGGVYSDVIQKFSFSSDGDATDIANLTYTTHACAGMSSSDNGYTAGGAGSGRHDKINKFSFSSGSNATNIGSLFSARDAVTGSSSTTYGYISGGEDSGWWRNYIEKVNFSSDGSATDVGDLTVSTGNTSGHQV